MLTTCIVKSKGKATLPSRIATLLGKVSTHSNKCRKGNMGKSYFFAAGVEHRSGLFASPLSR
jgi:hypothetical protein